jgi:hypothetical protein
MCILCRFLLFAVVNTTFTKLLHYVHVRTGPHQQAGVFANIFINQGEFRLPQSNGVYIFGQFFNDLQNECLVMKYHSIM